MRTFTTEKSSKDNSETRNTSEKATCKYTACKEAVMY